MGVDYLKDFMHQLKLGPSVWYWLSLIVNGVFLNIEQLDSPLLERIGWTLGLVLFSSFAYAYIHEYFTKKYEVIIGTYTYMNRTFRDYLKKAREISEYRIDLLLDNDCKLGKKVSSDVFEKIKELLADIRNEGRDMRENEVDSYLRKLNEYRNGSINLVMFIVFFSDLLSIIYLGYPLVLYFAVRLVKH